MRSDIFGQPCSLGSAQAVQDWNAAMLAFLAHGAATPTHLGRVLAAEPGFALGQATRGLFMLLLGRSEVRPDAQAAFDAARDGVAQGDATARERLYVAALGDWLDGFPSLSVDRLESVLRDHPGDTLAMKLVQAILFILGDPSAMRASVERVLPAYAPDHPGRGYLLGCHAFALEETGAYDRAEIAGRQALWLAPDDAWGLHAVAHVHDMTANARAGLDWLSGREKAWAHCNNFRYHVWWHKALMHLDLGQVDRVLALYDRQIRCDRTDDFRDISNATSLLMRLELDGVPVGDRWEELSELCAARTDDGALIFADLHYLLALTGDRRPDAAARMVRRIARDAQGNSDMGSRMADPGTAAARGLEAFGDGRHAEAFRHLAQARGGMQRAGGSHAQRDVFERITIDAGIRAGYLDRAELFLSERQARRAGREDSYAAARRALIAQARGQSRALSTPAQ